MPDLPQKPGSKILRIARFGAFELDLSAGELRRRGRIVALQEQQMIVLKRLVERAGFTVSREELRDLIWPDGTFVEFEFGLYSTVNRLRRALGDSASNPHFVETTPREGYRFIAAVEYQAVEEERAVPDTAPITVPVTPSRTTIRRRFIYAGAAAMLLLLGVLSGMRFLLPGANPTLKEQVYRYAIEVKGVDQIASLAVSPMGDQIVYQGPNGLLYRQYLDTRDPRAIHGTEDGRSPFFSPDGQSLGFFTEHELKIVEGSRVRQLATLPQDYRFWNAAWGEDAFVYFNSRSDDADGIWRVPINGGKPEPVVHAVYSGHGEQRPFVNQVLTRPRHLLLYSTNFGPVRRSLHALDLEAHIEKTIVELGIGGHLLPDGHLVFFRRGSLFVEPFDVRSLLATGTAVETVKDVADYSWQSGRAAFSNTGTLAYVLRNDPAPKQLEWLDPAGRVTRLPVPAARYQQAEVSPKGDLLAVVRSDSRYDSSLWTYSLHTGGWNHILDSHVPAMRAQWSPDETELVVGSEKQNEDFVNLWRISLADPRDARRLTEEPDYGQFPLSWSGRANAILFMEGLREKTNGDIMVLPLGRKQAPKRLVATPGWDRSASFSPDGRRFVYESDERGQAEIYVRGYNADTAEAVGAAVQISRGGGHDPIWTPDGRSLYYTDPSQRLMHVALSEGNNISTLRMVSASVAKSTDLWTRAYSMAPDGRLLIVTPLPRVAASAQIQIVVNWGAEVKRLAPIP